MKITIVMGFFLPMPPVSGGATEKSWYRLAKEFAHLGHEVTIISRAWPNLPKREDDGSILHIRPRGFDHTRRLWMNLILDFIWSFRLLFILPKADVVVVNSVCLPIFLGLLRRTSGKLVVMPGRMPKGQIRLYCNVARVITVSRIVMEKIGSEKKSLLPKCVIYGYPIDWEILSRREISNRPEAVTIGFVGRIHEEKGLKLLVASLRKLQATPDLPRWRFVLCGPSDVKSGGSGPIFSASLQRELLSLLGPDRFSVVKPVFRETGLSRVYQQLDIFCYPSLAAKGETFGVAVAEAMAAGAVPIVSQLECFVDLVRNGQNGLVFDQTSPDAATQLSSLMADLIRDQAHRLELAKTARADVKRYDFRTYATSLLDDFSHLVAKPAGSNAS